jgi:hypothetical protein
MVVKDIKQSLDLDHAEYLTRQWFEVSPVRVEACAHEVKPANHFTYQSGHWIPQEYEGFAVISMMDDTPINSFLSFQLQDLQDELLSGVSMKALCPLPKQSFHQTIANTLSGIRFKRNICAPGLEDEFPSWVGDAFRNISFPSHPGAVRMKLIGLSIFHTAIGILGVIESEDEYKKITSFRSQFYSDPQLMSVDVRMTRPFIGHITLAYIETELTLQEKAKLSTVVKGMNEKLRDSSYYFLISGAELRRYHHLAEFKTQSSYPTFNFNA